MTNGCAIVLGEDPGSSSGRAKNADASAAATVDSII